MAANRLRCGAPQLVERRQNGLAAGACGRLLVLVMLVACIGCGAERLPTVPVNGRVTFGGGPCPAEGTITFSPISVEQGMPRRPGTAEFKADGNFTATSFVPGDGLLPGRYRANISCWQGEPTSYDPSSFDRLNYVPKSYEPEEFVVESSDETVTLTFDVPLKK